jgi:hypothetical protein
MTICFDMFNLIKTYFCLIKKSVDDVNHGTENQQGYEKQKIDKVAIAVIFH